MSMEEEYYRGERIKVNGKTVRFKGTFGSAYIITNENKRVKRDEVNKAD